LTASEMLPASRRKRVVCSFAFQSDTQLKTDTGHFPRIGAASLSQKVFNTTFKLSAHSVSKTLMRALTSYKEYHHMTNLKYSHNRYHIWRNDHAHVQSLHSKWTMITS
jgi:hypothetical protein